MEEEHLIAPWVCLAVIRLGTRMATQFDERLKDKGVTQAQFRLLLAVHFEGGTSGIAPSILADHLMIERATVSFLAGRLVEQGFLARHPGENRRTHLLTLTPPGQQLLGQVTPHAVALAKETLAGITLEELRQMRTLLEGLETHIRTVTEQPSTTTR